MKESGRQRKWEKPKKKVTDRRLNEHVIRREEHYVGRMTMEWMYNGEGGQEGLKEYDWTG